MAWEVRGEGKPEMSLRHALLALIESGPFTGYDLTQKFAHSVEHVWRAGHTQIYPELRKLEVAGLISAEVVQRSNSSRSTKIAYHLTDEGRAELNRWVEEIGPQPPLRDPQYLKALYLEFSTPSNARRQFEAHADHYRQLRDGYVVHLEDIENARTDLMRRRLARSPESEHAAIKAFKAHVYRGLIARAEGEINWAVSGIALLNDLAATSSDPSYWTTPIHPG
jgi:DNA-binding PadR family transcriptional regulator